MHTPRNSVLNMIIPRPLTPLSHRNRRHGVPHGMPFATNIVPARSGGEAIGLELVDSEDGSEKQERLNRQATERMHIILPASPIRLPSSSGWSNAQISEHYSTCSKLLIANKINAKNAFSLHLIDCLADLIEGTVTSDETPNFQKAGGAIDASVRIYGCRVDVVHQQTYQVAGGLGKADKPNQRVSPEDNLGDGDNEDGEEGADSQRKRKSKKKSGLSSRIETKPEKLNQVDATETVPESDPLFRKVCMSLEDGSGGGLITSHLAILDDMLRLQLHSYDVNTEVARSNPNEESDSNNSAEASRLNDIFGAVDQMLSARNGWNLCPSLGQPDDAVDEEMDYEGIFEQAYGSPRREIAPLLHLGSYDADDNDVNLSGLHGPDGEVEGQGLDCGGEAVLSPSSSMDAGASASGEDGRRRIPIYDLIRQNISSKPLEYSYFSPKCVETWGGPLHWRLKRIGQRLEEDAAAAANRNANRKRKRAKDPMDFMDERKDLAWEMDAALDKLWTNTAGTRRASAEQRRNNVRQRCHNKALTMLAQTMLEKFTESVTTLQDSLNYDSSGLTRLNVRPCAEIPKMDLAADRPMLDPDETIADYDIWDPNKNLDFCPLERLNNFPGSAHSENGGDPFDDFLGSGEPYDSGGGPEATPSSEFPVNIGLEWENGDGMVAECSMINEPDLVAPLKIRYSRKAKQIDMKRLKSAMWNILTKRERAGGRKSTVTSNTTATLPSISEDPGSEELSSASSLMADNPDTLEPLRMAGEETFGALCAQLPGHVPRSMAKNLSVPIVFVSLLHMCNEKVLSLSQTSDLSDFRIAQPLEKHTAEDFQS